MYIVVLGDGTEKEVKVLPDDVTYYDGKYYSYQNLKVVSCFGCGKQVHENLTYHGYCLRCANASEGNDIKYCLECKHIHPSKQECFPLKDIVDVDEEACSYGKSVSVQTACHHFSPKGECKSNDLVTKIGQYQSERELPEKYRDEIKKFYHGRNIFNHYYYWGDYNIEGDVAYLDTRKFRSIINKLLNIKDGAQSGVSQGYKISPYRNYTLVGITPDGMLERAKYDLMGKEKHWTEKPNNFLQSIGDTVDNKECHMSLHYRLSSDLEHKMLAFRKNSRFGSCQKSENYDSYALGAYDAVTNGCNLPILIYRDGDKEPLGRITCRVMYDNNGKEYLLLERLYHDGTLGSNEIRGKMYAKIAYDLKSKGYNVIASNYSAHDSSTYSYLAKLGLSSETIVKDLVQPLRQIPNGYGYYCDGGTEVYHQDVNGIDWATDYLDQAYLI